MSWQYRAQIFSCALSCLSFLPVKLSRVINVRTYPDTSTDLRLRGVILLSNCVRRIVDTFRVHRFPIHLCALTLQALSVCGPCVVL